MAITWSGLATKGSALRKAVWISMAAQHHSPPRAKTVVWWRVSCSGSRPPFAPHNRSNDRIVPIWTPALYTSSPWVGSTLSAFPHATARVFKRPSGAFTLKTAFPGRLRTVWPEFSKSCTSCADTTLMDFVLIKLLTSLIADCFHIFKFCLTSWSDTIFVCKTTASSPSTPPSANNLGLSWHSDSSREQRSCCIHNTSSRMCSLPSLTSESKADSSHAKSWPWL